MQTIPGLDPIYRAAVTNATNTHEVRAAESVEINREMQDTADMEIILQSPSGRRFLWGLLEQCGCFRQTAVPGDPLATYFSEGRRSIGQPLLARLMYDFPAQYALMSQEAKVTREREVSQKRSKKRRKKKPEQIVIMDQEDFEEGDRGDGPDEN